MTIAELIGELIRFDPETPIAIRNYNYDATWKLDTADITLSDINEEEIAVIACQLSTQPIKSGR